MPLPPAPTKRAALLSPDALDAPARSSHRGSRRSGDARAETEAPSGPQALELFDRHSAEVPGGGLET
ncbi:PhoH family protein, partial [Variovorax sp. CT11-76]